MGLCASSRAVEEEIWTSEKLFHTMDYRHNGYLLADDLIWLTTRLQETQHLKDKAKQLMQDIDTNKDGTISKVEFDNYLKHWKSSDLKELSHHATVWQNQVKELFQALDTDHSQVLEKAELAEWVKNEEYFRGFHTQRKVNSLMSRLDAGHDGKVGWTELAHFFAGWTTEDITSVSKNAVERFRLRQKELQKALDGQAANYLVAEEKVYSQDELFKALDEDRSGYLHIYEMIALSLRLRYAPDERTQEKAMNLFTSMDKNKDGMISRVEFDEYFSRWSNSELEYIFKQGLPWIKKVRVFFHQLDHSQSRTIDKEEFSEFIKSSKYFATVSDSDKAHQLIKKLDLTHDEKINWTEFCNFFASWSVEEISKLA